MRANTLPALCARCGKRVEIGAGRFVGAGKILHNAPCQPFRKPSTKKMIGIGNRWLAPALLAVAVVIGTAAAGTSDYMLVMPERGIATGSKAKSLETCMAARQAAWDGLLPGVPPRTPSRCEPHPGAFDARSNCIKGFSC